MNRFERVSTGGNGDGLYADGVRAIQVNVGLRCNQSCAHCHLAASPRNLETMGWTVMKKVLDLVETVRPTVVDITGGAPELNPHLAPFVEGLYAKGVGIQIRTNLTALLDKEREGLPRFLRERRVRLVGSLPCYLEDNVRAQRGDGVYEKSVEAIAHLNRLGYGVDPDLKLDLVYNPGGAFLPGDQSTLQEAYRRELWERFGITFTNLLTITNMPIGRFGESLKREDRLDGYMELLSDAFNPQTLPGLMCRYQVSVSWDGALYDCDFNLALNMVMNHGAPDHIDRWDLEKVARRRIVTGPHCFGCTAGCGSSCGGALVEGNPDNRDKGDRGKAV